MNINRIKKSQDQIKNKPSDTTNKKLVKHEKKTINYMDGSMHLVSVDQRAQQHAFQITNTSLTQTNTNFQFNFVLFTSEDFREPKSENNNMIRFIEHSYEKDKKQENVKDKVIKQNKMHYSFNNSTRNIHKLAYSVSNLGKQTIPEKITLPNFNDFINGKSANS